ncbi:MAG: acetyl-coenzyme A synthetase N-terminal domain-containing protein, partial [Gammaproteobacteria bacterium]
MNPYEGLMLQAGDLLWEPSAERVDSAAVTKFIRWLNRELQLDLNGYHDLWQWSVDDLEGFWQAIWRYYDIKSSAPYSSVLKQPTMPGAKWFDGAKLNYAEHIFRHARDDKPAMFFAAEGRVTTEISWQELSDQVARIAQALRQRGVKSGDRVVA